jgi:hypothetical protein
LVLALHSLPFYGKRSFANQLNMITNHGRTAVSLKIVRTLRYVFIPEGGSKNAT